MSPGNFKGLLGETTSYDKTPTDVPFRQILRARAKPVKVKILSPYMVSVRIARTDTTYPMQLIESTPRKTKRLHLMHKLCAVLEEQLVVQANKELALDAFILKPGAFGTMHALLVTK